MAFGDSRAPTNPFYTSPPTSPPPSYSAPPAHGSRPNPGEPMQYGSLSDLTNGRAGPSPSTQTFNYQPQPERQGYRPQPQESYRGSAGAGGTNGRRVPPLPNQGSMPHVPPEPPRRTVATPPVPPRQQTRVAQGVAQVQGYIPDRASNTVTSAASSVRDGFNSFATNERKDQVMTGIGRLGAGAAKLGAKGVYQIGKFASK